MREVALDTETTGLDPQSARIVEIACVELVHQCPTGKHWQAHINPQCEVPVEATRIHGLTTEFLKDKPTFSEQYAAFLAFIGDAQLVIHNASFDMKFLNAELGRVGIGPLQNPVLDTLLLARKKYPGAPASLDALCRRFSIDLSARTYHGALVDTQLLAQVYLEMTGGRQTVLAIDAAEPSVNDAATPWSRREVGDSLAPGDSLRRRATPEEIEAHQAVVEKLGSHAVWRKVKGERR